MVGLVAKPRLVIWEMRKSMYYSVCKHGPNALVKAVQGVLLCAQRGGGEGRILRWGFRQLLAVTTGVGFGAHLGGRG